MRTYDEIFETMKNDFYSRVGYECDEASDTGIKLRVLAGEIYNLEVYLEWIKKQAFVQYAQGIYLDYHAQMRGLQRKTALKSRGSVRFSVTESSAVRIEIPEGTIVSTNGASPISFRTTQHAAIESGQSYVDVSAEAVSGGTDGNVVAGKISVIVTMSLENLSVTNPLPFKFGTDDEDDETLRQRVVNSLKFILNGTNREYYSSLAKTVEGVECVNVVPYKFGAGTVAVYISGKNARNDNLTLEKVRTLLQSQREINVNVFVILANIKNASVEMRVQLENGYDIAQVQENAENQLKALTENYEVGQSLRVEQINDVLFHTEGVKKFELLELSTTGISVGENEKMVFQHLTLRSW